MKPNTCAVVLAAGKGTRMKAGDVNKVTLPLNGKPIIKRIVENIESTGIEKTFVVVGHAKESVRAILGERVEYIEQKEQLGTGHAVKVALKNIPQLYTDVFVFYGDDTSYETDVLNKLSKFHEKCDNDLSFLTVRVDNPQGLGRIVRSEEGALVAIVEEKDATDSELKINEINPGCFLFKRDFLNQFIDKIPLNEAKGEYYITDIIKLGLESGKRVDAMEASDVKWRGVNTPEELKEAEHLIKNE